MSGFVIVSHTAGWRTIRTSNRRMWAEGIGAGGICLDAEGAVWAPGVAENAIVRVRKGGQVLETIELDRSPFACMLGGPDGRTLSVLAAEWRGIEKVDEAVAARTGQVLSVQAPRTASRVAIKEEALARRPEWMAPPTMSNATGATLWGTAWERTT